MIGGGVYDQLPQSLLQSDFIGRRAELEDLLSLLDHQRWLTLVGVGGCGKTALALQAAQRVRHQFEHGVCWVALDAVNEAALVSHAVAAALGIDAKPPLSYEDTLIAHLANPNLLLVLDNCEHVLAACRDLCDAIYETCPRVTLLMTSRSPLGSPNEVRWDAPLLTPEDATALFLHLARGFITPNISTQSHPLVVEICQRVDYLPLAIKLAAARTKVLSLAQIRDRLAQMIDVPLSTQAPGTARHATLRAAIEWSFDLLTSQEQQLFMRLSVFVGGFTLEAAEETCADAILPSVQVLPLLIQLIDHSLVVISARDLESMRYRLLEPVREFAAQQLSESTAFDIVHRQYVEWCHRLVKQAAQHWPTREQASWLNRLQAEHGNLRAVLRWCLDSGTTIELHWGLQIAVEAGLFWETRGHYGEAERWLRELLGRAISEIAVETRVEALRILQRLLARQGKYEHALQTSQQTVHLAQLSEDDVLVVKSINGLVAAHYDLGNFEAALHLLQDIEPLARGLADTVLLANVLNNYALVVQRVGDLREAQRLFEETLVHRRASGDPTTIGMALHNLAIVLESRGDYSRARQHGEEALAIWRELGDRHWEANTRSLLAGLLISSDRLSEAETYAWACLRLYEQLGNRADQVYPLADLARISLIRGDLQMCREHLQRMHTFARESGDKTQIARSLYLLALASAQAGDWPTTRLLCTDGLLMRIDIGSRFGVAACLEVAALICAHTHQLAEAAQCLGTASAIRESIDRPCEPFEEHLVRQTIETVRNQVGTGAFDDAWQRGTRQAFQDAAQFALEALQRQESEPAPDLRFCALGAGEVFTHVRQLGASDWTYTKSRELVFYLLLHPSATREEVGVDFWPDADTEQVRKRFSAALAHARTALGRERESIVLRDGHYALNPELRIWFDVRSFEDALKAAQRCLEVRQGGAEQQALRHLEMAAQLYRGDLLKDVDAEWVIAERESLRQKYLDALLKLGELYGHASVARPQDAVIALQRAVALDQYSEAAHVALIRVYVQLGDYKRAREQYRTYVAALTEIGARPSAETTALSKQLFDAAWI